MFGIPADPRLVEVLGWLLYAVPVLIVFLWPTRLAPGPVAKRRILVCTAAGFAATAAAMAVFIPAGGTESPGPTRAVTTAAGRAMTVTVDTDGTSRALTVTAPGTNDQHVRLDAAAQQTIDGIDVTAWQAKAPADPGVTTTPINLAELAHLAGGRLPVGLGSARTPGPFDATWGVSTVYTVLVHGDDLVAAEGVSTRVATLSGGGLAGPKVVSVGGLESDWATAASDDAAAAAQITQAANDRRERTLWTVWLPIVLATAAVVVSFSAVRVARKTPSTDVKTEGNLQRHGDAPKRGEIVVS
jgi:high-affinity iron transporter